MRFGEELWAVYLNNLISADEEGLELRHRCLVSRLYWWIS